MLKGLACWVLGREEGKGEEEGKYLIGRRRGKRRKKKEKKEKWKRKKSMRKKTRAGDGRGYIFMRKKSASKPSG